MKIQSKTRQDVIFRPSKSNKCLKTAISHIQYLKNPSFPSTPPSQSSKSLYFPALSLFLCLFPCLFPFHLSYNMFTRQKGLKRASITPHSQSLGPVFPIFLLSSRPGTRHDLPPTVYTSPVHTPMPSLTLAAYIRGKLARKPGLWRKSQVKTPPKPPEIRIQSILTDSSRSISPSSEGRRSISPRKNSRLRACSPGIVVKVQRKRHSRICSKS